MNEGASNWPNADASSPQIKVITFDNTKAGLQMVDKERTEALIREISKDSAFYVNEERKARARQAHIDRLKHKSKLYDVNVRGTPAVFKKLVGEVDALTAEIEAHQDFSQLYVHMDMDMFYAAVEIKKNAALGETPLGVGSNSMLSTTNYVARQWGVRAGMPGFVGRKLCPSLVIVPCDFPAYREEAATFRGIVAEYDPAYYSFGLDELRMNLNAYMDTHFLQCTTMREKFDAAENVLQECRARIQAATQLTASGGLATSPTLAKMASNYKKPNGQCTIFLQSSDEMRAFLKDIPVRQMPGIGKSQETILNGLGIFSMGDVYAERYRLYYLLTRKTYLFLLASSMGVNDFLDSAGEERRTFVGCDQAHDTQEGRATHGEEGDRQSIGQEATFARLSDSAALQDIAYDNLRSAQESMVKDGLECCQVVLKIKYTSFRVRQYTKTLPVYVDSIVALRRAMDELLSPILDQYLDFRLLGVRLCRLRRRQADLSGTAGSLADQRTISGSFMACLEQRKRRREERRMEGRLRRSERHAVNLDESGSFMGSDSDVELVEDEEGRSASSSQYCEVVSSRSSLSSSSAVGVAEEHHDKGTVEKGAGSGDIIVID